MSSIQEISVQKLKQMIDQRESFQLLDVREDEELEIAKLEPHIQIPLGELMTNYATLQKNLPTVIMCHRGGRSMLACKFLQEKGFQVLNLSGGIDAWAKQIDNTVSVY